MPLFVKIYKILNLKRFTIIIISVLLCIICLNNDGKHDVDDCIVRRPTYVQCITLIWFGYVDSGFRCIVVIVPLAPLLLRIVPEKPSKASCSVTHFNSLHRLLCVYHANRINCVYKHAEKMNE